MERATERYDLARRGGRVEAIREIIAGAELADRLAGVGYGASLRFEGGRVVVALEAAPLGLRLAVLGEVAAVYGFALEVTGRGVSFRPE